MSYNGSGTFLINTVGQPVASNDDLIDSTMNALVSDIASGLSSVICKDGQSTVLANIPMNSKKLTGLADGSARSDSATVANLQDGTGQFVSTVGGTADTITLTPSPAITAYSPGQMFRFIVASTNTSSVTVAISGLGAVLIYKLDNSLLQSGDLLAGNIALIVCDGSRFILNSKNRLNFNDLGMSGTATGTYTLGGTPTVSSQINLTSGQIAFPATQVPSAGANVLDDYEEGTWTPSLGGTTTYTTQQGSYTKIGNLVFIRARLVINSIGTGDTYTIFGMPFAASVDSYSSNFTIANISGSVTSFVELHGELVYSVPSSPLIYIIGRTAAAASSSPLLDVFKNGTSLTLSGSYLAA